MPSMDARRSHCDSVNSGEVAHLLTQSGGYAFLNAEYGDYSTGASNDICVCDKPIQRATREGRASAITEAMQDWNLMCRWCKDVNPGARLGCFAKIPADPSSWGIYEPDGSLRVSRYYMERHLLEYQRWLDQCAWMRARADHLIPDIDWLGADLYWHGEPMAVWEATARAWASEARKWGGREIGAFVMPRLYHESHAGHLMPTLPSIWKQQLRVVSNLFDFCVVWEIGNCVFPMTEANVIAVAEIM